EGLLSTRSFSLLIAPKWLRVEAALTLGPFAGALLKEMRDLFGSHQAVIEQLTKAAQDRGWEIAITVLAAEPPSERVVHLVRTSAGSMDEETKWQSCVEAGAIVLSIALAMMPVETTENLSVDPGAV